MHPWQGKRGRIFEGLLDYTGLRYLPGIEYVRTMSARLYIE
jgi:hypothetical protein